MADLSAIRTGLKTVMADLNIQTYDQWPGDPRAPCVLIRPVAARFHNDFSDQSIWQFEVVLLAAPAQPGYEQGQRLLDAYLDNTGASSVKAQIEDQKTWGGTVNDVIVRGWDEYGVLLVSEKPYWGARFEIEGIA